MLAPRASETAEQRSFPLQHGCDALQGHYNSVPIKATELVRVLRQRLDSARLRGLGRALDAMIE